jgi:hypothetical protein
VRPMVKLPVSAKNNKDRDRHRNGPPFSGTPRTLQPPAVTF